MAQNVAGLRGRRAGAGVLVLGVVRGMRCIPTGGGWIEGQ